MALIWSRFFPLMEFLANLCIVVLIGFGGYMVIHENLSTGELVAFTILIWYIIAPIVGAGISNQ